MFLPNFLTQHVTIFIFFIAGIPHNGFEKIMSEFANHRTEHFFSEVDCLYTYVYYV
jgi:hypothetical protein